MKEHWSYKHGEGATGNSTRLYQIWVNMRCRCNVGNSRSKHHGDRGIRVCVDWDAAYLPFRDWARKNGYLDNLIIHRKDNDGDYEPSNCEWLTKSNHMTLHRNMINQLGESNKSSKLTNRDVREIKDLLKKGIWQKGIADMYGVTPSNTSCINRGVSWNHIGA